MSKGRGLVHRLELVVAAAVGAAIAYLFDPVRGRSRRARLRDQAAARGRDVLEEAGRKARYQAGKVKGAVHERLPSRPSPPPDDATLLQKVRSEAVGPSGIPTEGIEIHVEEGVVHLRGTFPSPGEERELAERIRRVEGVRDVETAAL